MQTEVENALELRLALKRFAPDLAIETRKQMGLALSPLVTKARGFIPADTKVLSGWVKPLTRFGTLLHLALINTGALCRFLPRSARLDSQSYRAPLFQRVII